MHVEYYLYLRFNNVYAYYTAAILATNNFKIDLQYSSAALRNIDSRCLKNIERW